jgi:hypothetical protein
VSGASSSTTTTCASGKTYIFGAGCQ